ncbi:uncharacterized protein LOC128199162 [Bicyclus anynana]|uniref:Uncharacterized protein LOC128199162 n=1 Tax=Bicyclus anynana TaxID=110368 RepID=A0ABM3LWA9_BICAN|nr:uncharacterized protein LOC128199162 [Bicyclus anynana]
MVSKVLIALSLVTIAAAVPAVSPPWGGASSGGAWPGAGGVSPWIPPWVASAPWYPQWTPCTTVGSSCVDCTTRLVCTKIGGLQRACTDPSLPHCNLGECSATPSDECAAPAVPANAV